jgi:hypothetical protein
MIPEDICLSCPLNTNQDLRNPGCDSFDKSKVCSLRLTLDMEIVNELKEKLKETFPTNFEIVADNTTAKFYIEKVNYRPSKNTIYIDKFPITEISELNTELDKVGIEDPCHNEVMDSMRYLYYQCVELVDKQIVETISDFAKDHDKAREPIPVNNRASRRSKGVMQEKSKWKRSNMKKRFYE